MCAQVEYNRLMKFTDNKVAKSGIGDAISVLLLVFSEPNRPNLAFLHPKRLFNTYQNSGMGLLFMVVDAA